ncbi:MAG: hypothetical protein LBF39_05590 [Prevotellaceae bacterium]|nr:hypothetical protein [Prevotellaceae bacterium]
MKIKKYKSGGEIRTPDNFKQNKQEQGKNIKAYTFLAKEYGYKYELLSIKNEHGVKNPDALNLVTNEFSDAKISITENGKNAIQNSIKEAAKQFVSEVFIYTEKEYKMYDIWLGIKAALQKGRAKVIKTIIIKMLDGKVKIYDADKLRKVFNKSKGKIT